MKYTLQNNNPTVCQTNAVLRNATRCQLVGLQFSVYHEIKSRGVIQPMNDTNNNYSTITLKDF